MEWLRQIWSHMKSLDLLGGWKMAASGDLQSRLWPSPLLALDGLGPFPPRRSPFRWRRSSSANTTSQEDRCCRRCNRFYSWRIRCPYFWASTSLSSKCPTGKAPGMPELGTVFWFFLKFGEKGHLRASGESGDTFIETWNQSSLKQVTPLLWEAEIGNL